MQVLGERGMRVLTGERADAGRTALRRRAEGPGYPEPRPGKPVDVGRSDPGVAVDPEVAPAEIVGDEDHHVRLRPSRLREPRSRYSEGTRRQEGRGRQGPNHLPS